MSHGKFAAAVALIVFILGVPAGGASGDDLFKAVAAGDVVKVKALIAAGADVNYANPSDGMTPLMFAAEYGYDEIVETLLVAKADTKKTDHDGTTAIVWAARNGNSDVIRLFALASERSRPGSVTPYACKAVPDNGKLPEHDTVYEDAGAVSMSYPNDDGTYDSPTFFQADVTGSKVEWGTGIHGSNYLLDRTTGRIEWDAAPAYSYLSTIGHLDGRTEKDFKGVRQCRIVGKP